MKLLIAVQVIGGTALLSGQIKSSVAVSMPFNYFIDSTNIHNLLLFVNL